MANITRPTVNVKPLRKIIIDVSPLSMFSDTIAFLIEFENVTLHCKLLKDVQIYNIYCAYVKYDMIRLRIK